MRIIYGRETETSAAILDSQSVKTTETQEYAAMILPRKLKGENAIFW
jgi:hypothetical protein